MTKIIVRHRVRDYVAWRAAFDASGADRAAGLSGAEVFRRADDPDDVLVLGDAADLDRLRAWGSSPEVAAAMERAGVIGRPDVIVAA